MHKISTTLQVVAVLQCARIAYGKHFFVLCNTHHRLCQDMAQVNSSAILMLQLLQIVSRKEVSFSITTTTAAARLCDQHEPPMHRHEMDDQEHLHEAA
jgi:hypothetical protein